ncbi:hypothetical protein BC937DRAFT_95405 [Endogone sp. FLAS-F59071]|nr:hypothetical protein BC937DRAFT_95405 [Endogone sp. FLAS-F59071]|eukprot:RUS13390.1 hypothetical protein BC937DRAFT_95405 [Endogone sp. FLAS-F59071]
MYGFSMDKKRVMVTSDQQQADPTRNSGGPTPGPQGTDKSSPEYYIRMFMDSDLRSVTPKIVEHLSVSLRTMPLR